MRAWRHLKKLRLLLVLSLLASLGFSIVAVPFYFNRSTDFGLITVAIGYQGTPDFVGTLELKDDGTGELVLRDGHKFAFSFDKLVAERALYRAEVLWRRLPDGPGSVQDWPLILTYSNGIHKAYVRDSRVLPSRIQLATALNVGAWSGTLANREDVTLTFLAEVLETVSAGQRQAIVAGARRAGAASPYSDWLEKPMREPESIKNEYSLPPNAILTPPPSNEALRITNPEGKIDAVIVERYGYPYGLTNYTQMKQSSLFLVAKGAAVGDMAPYHYKDFESVRAAEWKRCVCVVYDLKGVELKWETSQRLHLYLKDPGILSVAKDDFRVLCDGRETDIDIEYTTTKSKER